VEQEKKKLKAISDRIEKMKDKHQKESLDDASVSDISLAFQIPIELISGVLVGAGIGYILDKLFDLESLFLITFIILGGIAGIVNVARMAQKTEDEKEE